MTMFGDPATDTALAARVAALEAMIAQLSGTIGDNQDAATEALAAVAGERASGDAAALQALTDELAAREAAFQAVDDRIGDEIQRGTDKDQQHDEEIARLATVIDPDVVSSLAASAGASAGAAAASPAARAEVYAPRDSGRFLAGPAWRGGFNPYGTSVTRNPEVPDLKSIQAGTYGDLFLIEWLRTLGMPMESELLNNSMGDDQLSFAQILDQYRGRIILLNKPTYYMDSPIPRDLLKNIVLSSASPGLGGPPTMIFERPTDRPFQFKAAHSNIRGVGHLAVKHLVKPAAGIPTFDFDGAHDHDYEVIDCRNSALGCRFANGATRIRIRHLITDCDQAWSADSTVSRIRIDNWTKVGNLANTVGGGPYVAVGTTDAGVWTPTATFAVPGTLADPGTGPSYVSTSAIWRRRGPEIKIRGSMTVTLPAYSGASGEFRIPGLFFPARAGAERSRIHLSDLTGFTWPGSTATDLFLATEPGTNYLTVSGIKSGGTRSSATTTSFPPGTYTFRFEGTYETEYGA